MNPLRRLIERRTFQTSFGEARCFITCDSLGNYVRVLSLDGTYQSATYLDDNWSSPPFAYILAFDCMYEAADNGLEIDEALMIGGGCFSYPKHFLTHSSSARMDVVEIDPVIVQIARERFYLDKLEAYLDARNEQDRMNIWVADGVQVIREAPDQCYDVVINDSFEGCNASKAFLEKESIKQIDRILRPKGLYMTNLVVKQPRGDSRELLAFTEALHSVFAHVHLIDASDQEFGGAENYIVIGTNGEYRFSNTIELG